MAGVTRVMEFEAEACEAREVMDWWDENADKRPPNPPPPTSPIRGRFDGDESPPPSIEGGGGGVRDMGGLVVEGSDSVGGERARTVVFWVENVWYVKGSESCRL